MSSPSHQTSLNRQQILEEDEYTAALSDIIARDFFPSLVHLDATNSYLDALQSDDTQLINASVRRLQDLATPQSSSARYSTQTPGRTPYGGAPCDTPGQTPRTRSNSTKRPLYDTSLSLDSFQAKFTSEDNASFTEILNEENRKRKERWDWAWEAQKRARDVKAIEMDRRDRLFIEDTTSQPPGVRERLMVETPEVKLITAGQDQSISWPEGIEEKTSKDDYPKANEMPVTTNFNVPHVKTIVKVASNSDDEVDVMASKKDTRSAAVDGWSFKTRNSLMFSPDADISPYNGPTSLPTTHSKSAPKQIKHANTRLLEQSNEGDNSSTVPSSPTRSKIGAAIAGTPYISRSDGPDFSLLPSLPSPTPSQLGPAAVNKLMTWGSLTSTPRVLLSDDPGPASIPVTPFHLPDPTTREQAAHKLSSTASRSLRAKASLLSGTPGASKLRLPKGRRRASGMTSPATPRPHPGLLTPAARRLLDRTAGLGTSAARRADVMHRESNWEGAKNRTREMGDVRWTPSPSSATRSRI